MEPVTQPVWASRKVMPFLMPPRGRLSEEPGWPGSSWKTLRPAGAAVGSLEQFDGFRPGRGSPALPGPGRYRHPGIADMLRRTAPCSNSSSSRRRWSGRACRRRNPAGYQHPDVVGIQNGQAGGETNAAAPRWGGIQPGAAAVHCAQHGSVAVDGDPPTVIFILEIDAGQRRGGWPPAVRAGRVSRWRLGWALPCWSVTARLQKGWPAPDRW